MDIRCKICGEPWDMDVIHDAISEQYPNYKSVCTTADDKWDQKRYEQEFYNPMRARFSKKGCAAIMADGRAPWCKPDELTTARSTTLDAIRDLAGDDADAAACFEEDAAALGLL